jgi:hypothetical protein
MPETRRILANILANILAATALVALGCTGQVADNGSGNPGGPGNPGGSGGPGGRQPGGGPSVGGQPSGPDAPGFAVFRRLNRAEYNNTVRDLLGDTTSPASTFPPDQDSAKSGYFTGGAVANADASHLLDATEALAAGAMGRLPTLLPCKAVPAAPADQDSCAKQFITQFGKRAFRRPLTPDETSNLTGFYTSQRMAGTDFPNAIRLVISAMLMSPQFLYRWEVTPGSAIREGNLVRYNSYETAARLSYLIWASMPDESGFALADQNKLSTPDQIEAEARRLLKDPRAKQALGDFFTQWLGVTELRQVPKDPKAYPSFTPEVAASMIAESATFAASTVVDGDGKLATVFTSNKSFVDGNLAKIYGVSGVNGSGLAPATLDANQRGGILTRAAFLTQQANPDESNPVRRGKLIADRVACIDVPPPPDNVPDPKPPSPNLSVRDRFSEHDMNPCAQACHSVFDPIGYAFENYNGVGAYQTMDAGKPVDASGQIGLDKQMRTFKNALELGNILAESAQVSDCMARQFLRYALRRRESAGDEASVASATAAFTKQGGNLRELIVGLTRTRAFTHRTPSNGEVLQ